MTKLFGVGWLTGQVLGLCLTLIRPFAGECLFRGVGLHGAVLVQHVGWDEIPAWVWHRMLGLHPQPKDRVLHDPCEY